MENPYTPSQAEPTKQPRKFGRFAGMIWKYLCGFLGGVLGLLIGVLFCYSLEQIFSNDLLLWKSDWLGLVIVFFVSVFAGLGMLIAESSSIEVRSAREWQEQDQSTE